VRDNPLTDLSKEGPRGAGCDARTSCFARIDRRDNAIDVVSHVGDVPRKTVEFVPQRHPLGVGQQSARGANFGRRLSQQHHRSMEVV
jgi:hypothetical protein